MEKNGFKLCALDHGNVQNLVAFCYQRSGKDLDGVHVGVNLHFGVKGAFKLVNLCGFCEPFVKLSVFKNGNLAACKGEYRYHGSLIARGNVCSTTCTVINHVDTVVAVKRLIVAKIVLGCH